MKIFDFPIQKRNSISTKTGRYARQALAIGLAVSFTTSVAFNCNPVLAQSKGKPTQKSATQGKRRQGEPQLYSYEFETVTVNANGEITSRRKGQARACVEVLNGVTFEMVEIPGGSFTMGSPDNTPSSGTERPAHQVMVPAFYIGKYEVTLEQWKAVAKLPKINRDLFPGPGVHAGPNEVSEPTFFKGDKLPVYKFYWGEAVEFCARLSRATGRTYRLPSEAEWEYACRAGTTTAYAFGGTITPKIVNYDGNKPYGSAPKGLYRNRPTPVGSLGVANAFGLYDMHGNASEWCLDAWHQDYNGAPKDGSARDDNDKGWRPRYVLRGGWWSWDADGCRSASRASSDHDTGGFRVVMTANTR